MHRPGRSAVSNLPYRRIGFCGACLLNPPGQPCYAIGFVKPAPCPFDFAHSFLAFLSSLLYISIVG